jgi:hypothetical protein
MAKKQTSIDVKGFESAFLAQKTSRYQAEITGSGYYTSMKHLKSSPSFQNRFISSFNSQVNPTILPQVNSSIIEILYLSTESGDDLITEDNNNLTI